MSKEIITIPKDEYELLVKCRHIVESEFEERFSERFIKEVKESEEAYKRGDYAKFRNAKEAKAYFDKL